MRILVTGGTGVIGEGVIPELLQQGHSVRLLSRGAGKDAKSFPEAVEAFAADITQPEQLDGAAENCECVIHITGIVEEQPPELTFERVNVEGTRHILDAAAAAGSPLFIYISSLGAERGQSDYHRSKRAAESLVREYPGPWMILRPGNVYGPGDDVISLLLKMTRTLPVVPVIDNGDQPFQPIWYGDLGAAVAEAAGRSDLAGRVLELAGPEVTTTNAVLDRLAELTGRAPARVPMPAWLAEFGVRVTEAFEGFGQNILEKAGFSPPINTAKVKMLLEGSVIDVAAQNALLSVFQIEPTPLDEGLEVLADSLPEQTPGDGFGPVEQKSFWADIEVPRYSAPALLNVFCDRISEIMPIEFAAEPGVPTSARPGGTLTGALPGRGNFQVRLMERTDTTATFFTVEGHPLAGLVRFSTAAITGGVRFSIDVSARAANLADWAGMQSLGRFLQNQNWRRVVRRVVELSGGTASEGVYKEARILSETDARRLEKWAEEMVRERKRLEVEAGLAQVTANGRPRRR